MSGIWSCGDCGRKGAAGSHEEGFRAFTVHECTRIRSNVMSPFPWSQENLQAQARLADAARAAGTCTCRAPYSVNWRAHPEGCPQREELIAWASALQAEKTAAAGRQEDRTETTRSLCWLPRYQAGHFSSQENDSHGWSRREETRQLAGRIGYRAVTETFRAHHPDGEQVQDTPVMPAGAPSYPAGDRGAVTRWLSRPAETVTGAVTGVRVRPSRETCWDSHPAGQSWLCDCTPLTRYGSQVPDLVPDKRLLPGAGPARERKDIAGTAVARTGPPADCQEALHREVTGRAPAPTLEGWREEFAAFGGDYAKDRMLSYVTLDTRCVIDPPEKPAPGSPAPRRPRARDLVPHTRNLIPFLITAAAIAVVVLVVAGDVTPAAVLILILAVVAVIRQ